MVWSNTHKAVVSGRIVKDRLLKRNKMRKENLTWSNTHKAVVSGRIVKDEEELITQSLLQIERERHVTVCEILDTSEQKYNTDVPLHQHPPLL